MVAWCCWRNHTTTRDRLHSGRLYRSRSLDREPTGEYLDLVLEEPSKSRESPEKAPEPTMGNSNGGMAVGEGQKDDTLMKSASSTSLKSNGSHKSSSSRRSKVTFTDLNPEIYVIPKSPPKPKRTKGPTRSPVTAEEEMDLIMAMRGDETDQSAFQFDLSQHAEVVSLEDIGRNTEKPYNGYQEKIYDQVPDREDTPEDVQQVEAPFDQPSQEGGKLSRV